MSSLKISSARLNQDEIQSDAKFTRDLWACPENDKVGYRDTQFYVTICPGYAHLRQDKNLIQDKDIVQ